MSGTSATYQGFPCRDVRFRRTRGWQADTTTVLFFAADFPAGFQFVVPTPGDLVRETTVVRPEVDVLQVLQGKAKPPRPIPRRQRLEYAGPLVLAEVDARSKPHVVVVDPLYCVSLETVRRNADGSIAVVRARLVDARYFYARGFLRRWSFNRADGAGLLGADSQRPGAEPWTLHDVARDVASSLFGTPALAHAPERWRDVKPGVELTPFGAAAPALAHLAQDHGAGELCLNLDNSVALYAQGEGRVGHCPGGKGTSNSATLPPELLLDLEGSGQTQGVEAGYPPDYVVVVGGLRVASVRLDGLDPVLVVNDVVLPLDEATVRKLTGGKRGLDWLHVFVLAPQAYQRDVEVDSRVVDLLREQAYRLWRIPGVEREQPANAGTIRGPLVAGLPGGRATFDALVDRLRREAAESPNRGKGPNAHLLPLLDRAETVHGRRLPVAVEAYRFASVHRAMATDRVVESYTDARAQLQRLRAEIEQLARAKYQPDPWNSPEITWGFDGQHLSRRAIGQLRKELRGTGVQYEELLQYLHRVHLIDRIGRLDPRLAGLYQQEVRRLVDGQQQLGRNGTTLHELALVIAAFEKDVAAKRASFETPDEEAAERGDQLQDLAQEKILELRRLEEERQARARVGARPRFTEQTAVVVRNLPRQLDAGARVYSDQLGVIQTSDMCGHVAEEGVPVAEATRFVPRSPLVTFGAVLRPRVDVAPNRTATGGRHQGVDESQVPHVLTDQESYYTAAWKRLGLGRAEVIPLEKVPPGQGVAIERPELVELVPLTGESNRAALDRTAEVVALEQFRRPEKVEARKTTVGRPWPVNCDGVVAAVEIALRPNAKGFVTTIYTGSEPPVLTPAAQTRVRMLRRWRPSDATAREGLTP